MKKCKNQSSLDGEGPNSSTTSEMAKKTRNMHSGKVRSKSDRSVSESP